MPQLNVIAESEVKAAISRLSVLLTLRLEDLSQFWYVIQNDNGYGTIIVTDGPSIRAIHRDYESEEAVAVAQEHNDERAELPEKTAKLLAVYTELDRAEQELVELKLAITAKEKEVLSLERKFNDIAAS